MTIKVTIRPLNEGNAEFALKTVEPILKTENLWKLYHAGKVEVPALRGVNFEVLPGESVAVMGPSGCGKSSLLYVIGGLAQASRGKVLVDGNDLAEMTDAERTKLRRSKIGFVFQCFGHSVGLSVCNANHVMPQFSQQFFEQHGDYWLIFNY